MQSIAITGVNDWETLTSGVNALPVASNPSPLQSTSRED
jgi:hypothetical protein